MRPPKRSFGIEATAGPPSSDKKMSGLRFDEILPGNYDGKAHVADMAAGRRRRLVVYPNNAIFIYIEPDRELALACMRSYNDWVLDEFQGAAPDHIVGAADAAGRRRHRRVHRRARPLPREGRARRVHPRLPGPAVPRSRTTTRSTRAPPKPACRSRSTARSAASRRKPTTTSWSSRRSPTAGTVYRFFAAVRPVHLHGDGRRVRPSSRAAVRRGRGELRVAPVLGADDGAEPRHPRRARRRHRGARTLSPTELLGRNLFVTVLDDYVGFQLMARLPVAGRRVACTPPTTRTA